MTSLVRHSIQCLTEQKVHSCCCLSRLLGNRTIKELSSALKKTTHNLIISSHLFPSSEELDELMAIVNLPLPEQKELKNLIKKIATNTNSNLEELRSIQNLHFNVSMMNQEWNQQGITRTV